MKINDFINPRCKDEAYGIGYRKYCADDMLMNKNNNSEFYVMKPSFRYWYADPIVNVINEKEYVYCEMYDRILDKGCIGISYFKSRNGKVRLSRPQKIISDVEHLSFPVIFKWKEHYYMWPCIGTNNIKIYKMCANERKWKLWYEGVTDEIYVDGVFQIYKEKLYMIASVLDEKKPYYTTMTILKVVDLERKNGLHLEKTGIKGDYSNATRNAGKLIEKNGDFWRVCQKSEDGKGYGISIIFNKINMESDKYSEIKGEEITHYNIKTSIRDGIKYNIKGLHTYSVSQNNKIEVIDVKMKAFSWIFITKYIYRNMAIIINDLRKRV